MEQLKEYSRFAHFDEKLGYYVHVFPSQQAVRVCDGKEPKPIHKVKVRVDENGDYYAFLRASSPRTLPENELSLIFRSRLQVDVCFAEGVDNAVARGKGKLVRVTITPDNP